MTETTATSSTQPGLTVLRHDAARDITADGFTFHPLAAPSTGTTDLAVWTADAGAGASSSVHSMDREELFLIVAGALTFHGPDGTVHAHAGEAVLVPARTQLRVTNEGREQATLIAITSAGMRVTIGATTATPPWAQ